MKEDTLVKKLIAGDRTALAQAITLTESNKSEHTERANTILEKCLAEKKDTIRIGITGVPGVGKSTFIEAFGKLLTGLGNKVAVLAVDPSSTLSKGSILGDKTRMNELSKDPNAFIRPSASGSSLGGVARKTKESIQLCEAAGYSIIFVETVGVGQSETAVNNMVDFFLLLKLAGAGDELQGIKRGIMEMADAIVINKADGENIKQAKAAKIEFQRALHLYPPNENGWVPKTMTCSAMHNEGIKDVWKLIQNFVTVTKKNGHFDKQRKTQDKNWFINHLDELIKKHFYDKKNVKIDVPSLLEQIEKTQITPFKAAQLIAEKHLI